MSTITIGFSKPASKWAIFGRAIMLYNSTPYSHCYIKFSTSGGVDLISQASKGMVNFMSVPAFIGHNTIVREFQLEVSAEQLLQIKVYCMQKAGLPYSVKQIIGILIADLFHLDKNPLDADKDTFICSEFLGEILSILNIHPPKDLSLLAPIDIYKELEKSHV